MDSEGKTEKGKQTERQMDSGKKCVVLRRREGERGRGENVEGI